MSTKRIIGSLLCLGAHTCLLAQSDVPTDAATVRIIQSSSESVRGIINLCYTIGALCGMIGAVMAYSKILDGQTSSVVAIRNWFIACVALILLPFLARSIVGL